MSGLRVGDEEREGAVAALGTHFAAGRLTPDEFELRVGRAAAARVRDDLGPLFDDLPPPHPAFLTRSLMPDELRALLEVEGALVLDENVPGELMFRRYRAPGVHHRNRTVPVTCTVAVTGRRLAIWADGGKQVDVRFDQALRAAVAVTARPGELLVSSDVGAFHHDRSGRMELRIRTSRAADVAELWATPGR